MTFMSKALMFKRDEKYYRMAQELVEENGLIERYDILRILEIGTSIEGYEDIVPKITEIISLWRRLLRRLIRIITNEVPLWVRIFKCRKCIHAKSDNPVIICSARGGLFPAIIVQILFYAQCYSYVPWWLVE